MKEFTFDTSDMSNITLYTATNTNFDTSNMSNISLYCRAYPSNYTVDPNMKPSNYNKIQLKALNYFIRDTLN